MGGDEATAELVEVSEEFSNTDALLRAVSSDSSQDVIEVVRVGASLHSLVSTDAGLSLGEKVPGVVEISANSKQVGGSINVFTEVHVVNFINVTLVHVFAENLSSYVFGS